LEGDNRRNGAELALKNITHIYATPGVTTSPIYANGTLSHPCKSASAPSHCQRSTSRSASASPTAPNSVNMPPTFEFDVRTHAHTNSDAMKMMKKYYTVELGDAQNVI